MDFILYIQDSPVANIENNLIQRHVWLTAYLTQFAILTAGHRQAPVSKTAPTQTQPVYRSYKDRAFRLLFQDKKRLLDLYNALNNTTYTDEEALTINTLENTIFMKMRNDISFLIDLNMSLYEHQSSYCPNMPLRGLLYFADLYKKYVGNTELSGRKLIRIPAPHFIVFYNGTERQEEEFIQKLSDSYEGDQEGCMELTVRTAIDTCIEQNILKEFLTEQKAEVIAMSIYEYDEEKAKRYYFSEGYEDGKILGKAAALLDNVASIMKNLNISLSNACDLLGITVEDYHLAEQNLSQQGI